MPSPDTKRNPPPRLFRDYVLSREQRTGLSGVTPRSFTRVPGVVGEPWSDADGASDFSDEIELGFVFSFNGVEYTKCVISANGWLVLLDPSSAAPFALTDVFTTSTPYLNQDIRPAFRLNHVLIAPWFDDLRNLTNNLTPPHTLYPYPVTSDLVLGLYEKGYWNSNAQFLYTNIDPLEYGVRYHRRASSPKGRAFIVRWGSAVASGALPGSILKFEAVVQENGEILFNYGPRDDFQLYFEYQKLNPSSYSDITSATVGIFLNGVSTWNFRDFSAGLGYRDDERTRYKYGGVTYDPAYTDPSVPYTARLKFSKHWPGDQEHGCSYRFMPPMNRRRVLPRKDIRDRDSSINLPTVARTGDSSRSGAGISTYDDRVTLQFAPDMVNYPTTLPRYYGETAEGVSDRQDLFSGDFVFSASVSKSAVENFIGNKNKTFVAPFNEHKIFENDHVSSTDKFYSAGTLPTEVGMGFANPLKSKTHVKLSFRVDEKTTLFGASSSICYYNAKTKRWQYPVSATDLDGLGLSELPTPGEGAWQDPDEPTRIVEIDRGFNAYGFPISSGSGDRSDQKYNGTSAIFNTHWTSLNETRALSSEYAKSFQASSVYDPKSPEKFTLPINQPFLLEKAVIEIPFEAGPSWFLDKTQCYLPFRRGSNRQLDSPFAQWVTNSLGEENYPVPFSDSDISYRSNAFDVGGPALTVGLFNNVRTGVNTQRRELILSGTVTHYLDDQTEIKLYDYEVDDTSEWQVVPRGFRAYGTPTTVVSPTEQKDVFYNEGKDIFLGDFFTGSVKLECVASIVNGVVIRDTFFLNYVEPKVYEDTNIAEDLMEIIFETPTWKMGDPLTHFGSLSIFDDDLSPPLTHVYGFREKTIVGANNLGRSSVPLVQSGRSYFGKDFSTSFAPEYDNPFYLYDVNDTKSELINKLTDPTTIETIPKVFITHVYTKHSSKPSPYLLLPGDELSLTVSKAHPFCYTVTSPFTSGTIPFTPEYLGDFEHDIKMLTGSINITLYGSLVTQGREYHDTLNQPLSSDAVHEVVIGGTDTWR